MSLVLTRSKNVEVNSVAIWWKDATAQTGDNGVFTLNVPKVCSYDISIDDTVIDADDFCNVVMYFLMNTDLVSDDPRLILLQRISKLKIQEGHNEGKQALVPTE